MNIIKQKQNKKLIIIFIALVFLLFWLYGLISNYIKNNNIYNVKAKEYVDIKLNVEGILIFDEFVYDQFNGKDINIDPNKIIRNGENVDETINVSANSSAAKIENFINEKSNTITNTEEFDLTDVSKNVKNNNFFKLNANYLDSINGKNKYYNFTQDNLSNFITNKSIQLDKSGYLINRLDGYESIFSFENIDTVSNKSYTFEDIEKRETKGLKYLNNKNYYILIQLDNNVDIYNYNFNNIKIEYEGMQYLVNKSKLIERNTGGYNLLLDMYEGLDTFKDKRLVSFSLIFASKNLIKVPNSAIVEQNDVEGVFIIKDGKLNFAPVKIEIVVGNNSYVRTDKKDIYSQAYLDLVENNNNNLLNDVNDPNFITLNELNEFDEIVLTPQNLKEGDTY